MSGRGRIDSMHVTYRADVLHIDIDGFIPTEDLAGMQESLDVLREYLSKTLHEPVVIEVDVVPLDAYHFLSAPEGRTDATGIE